jgi:hypothetical protein
MKTTMQLTGLIVALAAGTASASIVGGDTFAGDLHLLRSYTIGQPEGSHTRAYPGAAYSNVDNFSGASFVAGGAANQAGNTITRLAADDITPAAGFSGSNISRITFSVANLNSANVSARARVRFYNGDGTGGAPGTVLAGFSFNPISFAPGVSLFFFNPGAAFNIPSGTFWAGMTFDDNTGATGATAAQLNNLGQGVFNPPVIGSSADQIFVTTGAGSFLAANPAGATQTIPGSVANLGWEFVPAPGTLALLGLGGLMAARRRR